jgi:hypothetical protein
LRIAGAGGTLAAMGARRILLVTLAGVAPLGGASLMEGCGSAPAAGVGTSQVDGASPADGASPEASLAGGEAGIDPGIDGAPGPDAGAPPTQCWVCPDGGYFITIDGDGVTQTLRSNSANAVFDFGKPGAPWSQAYYEQGLSIGGSTDPDGGASLEFDIEIKEDPDGGLTIFGPGAAYSYAYYTRQDGTSFSPAPGLSASMTLTEVGPPGGVVAGSYTVTVVDKTQGDAGSLSLSGTFSTCRLCDYIGPTPPHQ